MIHAADLARMKRPVPTPEAPAAHPDPYQENTHTAQVRAGTREADNARGSPQMSQSKPFDISGRDKRARRAFFARRWSEFVRAHYQSPEHVSVVFNVRYQTAWNWWEGLNRPEGDTVAHAYDIHPEAHAFLSMKGFAAE